MSSCNRRSRSAGRARPRGKSIYDRLYGESRLLKENREKAIKQKEKSSMEGLFKPQIKVCVYMCACVCLLLVEIDDPMHLFALIIFSHKLKHLRVREIQFGNDSQYTM